MDLKEKSMKSKLGGKPTSIHAFGGLFKPRTQPVLAVALSLILAALVFSIAVPYAEAADPGHAASSISSGQFESGDYTFPSNLTVTRFFIANGTTLFVDAMNGRVGIGTASPENLLDIRNTGGNANLSVVSATNNISYLKLLEGANGEPINDYGGFLKYVGSPFPNNLQIGTIEDNVEYTVITIPRAQNLLNINAILNVTGEINASNLTVPVTNQVVNLLKLQAESNESGVSTGFGASMQLCNERVSGGVQCVTIEALQEATSGEAFAINLSDTSATDFYIDPAGLVGIGTGDPENTLDIRNAAGSASMAVAGGDLQDASIKLMETASVEPTNDYGGWLEYQGAGNLFKIGTLDNGVEYPVIYIPRATSNVGIGITSPSSTLHVNSSSGAGSLQIQNTTGASHLFVNGTTGLVGIGTTAPSNKLDVAGDINASSGSLIFYNEIMPDGATCSNGQILKKTASNDWDCVDDATGGGNSTEEMQDAVGGAFDTTLNYTDASNLMGLNRTWLNNSGVSNSSWYWGNFRVSSGACSNVCTDADTSCSLGACTVGSDDTLSNPTVGANLNMSNYLIENIGNAGTDFTSGGGLNLAGNLGITGTVSNTIAGNSTFDGGTLFVDSNNDRVGMGTTSPTTKLDVNGSLNITDSTGRIRTPELCLTSDSCRTTWPTGGGGWTTSGGYVYNSTTTGVGIGTASPVTKLHLNGGQFTINSTSGHIRLHDADEGNNADYIRLEKDSGAFKIEFWNNTASSTTDLIHVSESGNVGIGATTPAAQFTVVGAGQTSGDFNTAGALGGTLLAADSGTSPGNGGAIVFSANGQSWRFAAIKAYVTDGSNNSTGDLTFGVRKTTTDSTLTEAMRITKSGNVGIGTASPNSTFFVYGTNMTLRGSATGYTDFQILDKDVTSATNGAGFRIRYDDITGDTYLDNLYDPDGNLYIRTRAGVTPVNAIFINNSGRVGIGTTGPDAKLDVLATSGEQMRLTYTDGSAYSNFTVNSGGDLTIRASGGDVTIRLG